LEAASKAVWLAAQVAKENGWEVIKLNLKVDAQWLAWANSSGAGGDIKRGGKARKLADQARKCAVLLNVIWVEGEKNPADTYTTCKGYMSWKEGLIEIEVKDVEQENSTGQ
jgi:hypothetical protein